MLMTIHKMNVISNIQAMNQNTNTEYNPMIDFERLELMTVKELEAERDQLIQKYNESCQKRK